MEILGTDYDLVTLDYETYFGTGCSLSLQSMNTFTYLAHPDFSIHGVGIKINSADTEWVRPEHLVEFQHDVFDEGGRPIALLAHNTCFDAFILHHFWDIHPSLYLDTLAMSRGMFPGRKHGLKELAERLWPNDPTMRKGEELESFRNVTTEQLYADPKLLDAMTRYCVQDVDLTHAAFLKMLPYYPSDELELIHLTTQMMCEPMFVLDKQLLTEARDQWIAERQAIIDAAPVAESTLNSNPKFEKALTSRGVNIIHKADLRTGKMKPAFGKADLGFQQMKAAHPDLAPLFEGRVAAKSVGQIRRADRFLETAEICGGQMPMPLKYYSALTGRYGGGELINVQNMTRGSALRKSLCSPPGYLVAVADSSNIEARMLAWLAGQEELLDVFRSGGDVYSHFASHLYGRTIDKKNDPHERFIGKVCVLGLGYGQGHARFRENMAAGMLGGPPVLYTEQEAREIVQTYRTVNYAIPAYWAAAQQAIIDMYMGNEYDWGPLRVVRNAIIMPNGMALQYPGLRPDDDGQGFEYHNGQYWTRLYGPKLCLAEGTQVLTRQGWAPIEEVVSKTEVWDGDKWVTCDGSVYNGTKQVLELSGVTMTPDHEVLTDEGWKTASQSQGLNRHESRLPDGDGVRWKQWQEIPMVGSLRLRQNQDREGFKAGSVEKEKDAGVMRMQTQRVNRQTPHNTRDVKTSSIRGMAFDERPLPSAITSGVGQLRRSWHQSVQTMARVIRELLGGYGRLIPVRANLGSNRQRHGLRTGQLSMGHSRNAGAQQTQKRKSRRQNSGRTCSGVGDTEVNNMLPPRSWLALGQATDPAKRHQPVYDLINCGPDNRFVVRDGNGNPMIVHNCENITQALSRIVLFDQMLEINRHVTQFDGRVVLNVHDEIIAIVPEARAEEDFAKMIEIMSKPPEWCSDLPLDAEGGFDVSYSK